MTRRPRTLLPALLGLAALLALPALAPRAAGQDAPRRTAEWSERALELAAAVPVQDGGRVIPESFRCKFFLLPWS